MPYRLTEEQIDKAIMLLNAMSTDDARQAANWMNDFSSGRRLGCFIVKAALLICAILGGVAAWFAIPPRIPH